MPLSELIETAVASLRSSPLARRIRRNRFAEFTYQTLGRGSLLTLHHLQLELEILPSDTLIDCGANVGQVTSQFARTGAKVHAFEPNPSCYRTLRERFKFVRNVELYHAGVMDRACTLPLHVRRQTVGLGWETSVAGSFESAQSASVDHSAGFDRYDVECIDLSEWVLSNQARVRLLKIDIEGSEVRVINRLIDTGAIEQVDLIVCETHEIDNPSLYLATQELRLRIEREGLASRIRLDWP